MPEKETISSITDDGISIPMWLWEKLNGIEPTEDVDIVNLLTEDQE